MPTAMDLYFHVHLVSDSTGETLITNLKAGVAQFAHVSPIEHMYALVRSPRQLDRVKREIDAAPGVVLFTLVNPNLRAELEAFCQERGYPYLAILDPLLDLLGGYLGTTRTGRVGAQHAFDKEYQQRIEAMNFAMTVDDGQNAAGLEDADVVLVGVSRTSKTPTSIYLANRGIKAANVPLVPGLDYSHLNELKRPMIVGLTISPDRLVQIRRNRLTGLKENRETAYVDLDAVRQELIDAKRLFQRSGWPVIDVSRRSIEETAAQIINLLSERRVKSLEETDTPASARPRGGTA